MLVESVVDNCQSGSVWVVFHTFALIVVGDAPVTCALICSVEPTA